MPQDFNRVFASTGTSDTFSDAEYNEGLEAIVGAVPPDKAQHNGIWNEVDLKLLELKSEGVGVWAADIQYYANKSTTNVGGVLYRCAIDDVGTNPVGDLTGTWVKIGTTTLFESLSGVGDATVIDWTATGFVLSDFDCVLFTGDLSNIGVTDGRTSILTPPAQILGAVNRATLGISTASGASASKAVLVAGSITETGCTVETNDVDYVSKFTGVYGIKY